MDALSFILKASFVIIHCMWLKYENQHAWMSRWCQEPINHTWRWYVTVTINGRQSKNGMCSMKSHSCSVSIPSGGIELRNMIWHHVFDFLELLYEIPVWIISNTSRHPSTLRKMSVQPLRGAFSSCDGKLTGLEADVVLGQCLPECVWWTKIRVLADCFVCSEKKEQKKHCENYCFPLAPQIS